jgi:hypothetical protein
MPVFVSPSILPLKLGFVPAYNPSFRTYSFDSSGLFGFVQYFMDLANGTEWKIEYTTQDLELKSMGLNDMFDLMKVSH